MTALDPTLTKEFKDIGSISVVDVVDNPDGTCTIHFDVSEEFKNNLVQTMGWNEWSQEKFEQLFMEALTRAVENRRIDRIED